MRMKASFSDSAYLRRIMIRTTGLRYGTREHWLIRNTAYRSSRHPHIGAEYI